MLVGLLLGRAWVEIDRLGSRDDWAVMDAAAVTGLVKCLMYEIFGATLVGSWVFLFWKTSRLFILHLEFSW